MGNLAPSAANVAPAKTGQRLTAVTVGEAVVHGDVGRYNAADKKYYLADATSETNAKASGFFLSSASAGGVAIWMEGDISLGAIMTLGTLYFLSATPGKICLESDLVSGNYKTTLGIASSTSVLPLKINASGVPKP